MKITKNRTKYDARVMAEVIKAVYRWMQKDLGTVIHAWPRMAVDVRYVKGGGTYVTGCASLRGWSMTLRLPRPLVLTAEQTTDPREVHRVEMAMFGWLVWHELLHSFGYNHNRFSRDAMHPTDYRERFQWLVDRFGPMLPDAVPVVKPKPSRDQVIRRKLADVDAKTKRWTTKARRAATALRKLKAARKRYERALAELEVKAATGPATPASQ